MKFTRDMGFYKSFSYIFTNMLYSDVELKYTEEYVGYFNILLRFIRRT